MNLTDVQEEKNGTVDKNVGELYLRMKIAEHDIQETKQTTTTKRETEELDTYYREQFERQGYKFGDIRNTIHTTDSYIEKFLPIKLLKLIGKYLIELFGTQIEDKILLSERDKVKALYLDMLDDSRPQITFKVQMALMREECGREVKAFGGQTQKGEGEVYGKEYDWRELLDGVQRQEVGGEERDVDRRCQMIIEAVDKVIGTTTMNPEIIMQLRKNTSEMCDIKFEMLNL